MTINEQLIGAVSLLQRQWMSKKCHKNFIKLKKAVVILQAHGRRLYFWGVTDECSDTVLKVLEVRKIITSIKHALSIVRYFEFHMLTVAGWMIIKMKVRWLIADWNNSNSLGQWDRVSHIEIFYGASFLLSFT